MLRNRWRRRADREQFPLAAKRAQMLPTAALFEAVDAHLYYVGSAMQQWRRGGGEDAADAALKNLLSLLEIVRELERRRTTG